MSGVLTELERRFLLSGPRALARIATVDAEGEPHVVPGGWAYDGADGVLLLGGRDVLNTARARHVRSTGRAAVTIDGVADGGGWAPWALLVRGRAEVVEEKGAITLRPTWTRSWGLEGLLDA